MKKLIIFLLSLFSLSVGRAQWSSTNLFENNATMGAAAAGNTFWFAGGQDDQGFLIKRVEIYDAITGTWTYQELSEARSFPTGLAYGGRIFFAGGASFNTGQVSASVDIWNGHLAEPYWSVAQLSLPRFSLSAVAGGNTVLFAGGADLLNGLSYALVDKYNLETQAWSTDNLSQPRAAMGSAQAYQGKDQIAIFAGGFDLQNLQVTDRVDIYNFTTGQWTTTSLSEPRGFLAATTIGCCKVLFAGGMTNDNTPSDVVDIWDTETGEWTTATLSVPRAFFGSNAATACDKAFFAGGGHVDLNTQVWESSTDVVDIYNATTDTWSVGHLSHPVINHAIAASDNHVLFAGGVDVLNQIAFSTVDIYTCQTDAVSYPEKLAPQFSIYPNPTRGILYFENLTENNVKPLFVSLSNLQGQHLFSLSLLDDSHQLTLPALPAGAYLVTLVYENGSQSNLIRVE